MPDILIDIHDIFTRLRKRQLLVIAEAGYKVDIAETWPASQEKFPYIINLEQTMESTLYGNNWYHLLPISMRIIFAHVSSSKINPVARRNALDIAIRLTQVLNTLGAEALYFDDMPAPDPDYFAPDSFDEVGFTATFQGSRGFRNSGLGDVDQLGVEVVYNIALLTD